MQFLAPAYMRVWCISSTLKPEIQFLFTLFHFMKQIKPRFYFNNWLAKLLKVGGITLYPFILIAVSEEEAIKDNIIQHEMVHTLQIHSLGWFGMYWKYLVDYSRFRFAGLNHSEAYFALPLEVEAYKMAKEKSDFLLCLYFAIKES